MENDTALPSRRLRAQGTRTKLGGESGFYITTNPYKNTLNCELERAAPAAKTNQENDELHSTYSTNTFDKGLENLQVSKARRIFGAKRYAERHRAPFVETRVDNNQSESEPNAPLKTPRRATLSGDEFVTKLPVPVNRQIQKDPAYDKFDSLFQDTHTKMTQSTPADEAAILIENSENIRPVLDQENINNLVHSAKKSVQNSLSTISPYPSLFGPDDLDSPVKKYAGSTPFKPSSITTPGRGRSYSRTRTPPPRMRSPSRMRTPPPKVRSPSRTLTPSRTQSSSKALSFSKKKSSKIRTSSKFHTPSKNKTPSNRRVTFPQIEKLDDHIKLDIVAGSDENKEVIVETSRTSIHSTPKKTPNPPTSPPTVRGVVIPFATPQTPSKRMRVVDELDYYQKKSRQLKLEVQIKEKEAEKARYAAAHYMQIFNGPNYNNDRKSIGKLMSRIGKYKSEEVKAELSREGDPTTGLPYSIETIYEQLEKNGHLDQYTLPEFRAASFINTMDLTISFEKTSDVLGQTLEATSPDTEVLKELVSRKRQVAEAMLSVLSQPNSFKSLVSLRLSKITMSDSYLIHLHGLAALEELFLDDTNTGDEGVAHLVVFKKTLKLLDLSNNKHITDRSFANLRFFEKFGELFLSGTSVTINGLRIFVKETKSKGLYHLAIPDQARKYLSERHRLYCVDPNQIRKPSDSKQKQRPFIIDPRRVPLLSLAHIKIQLAFHYEVNPRICVTGSQSELAERLKEILGRRQDDGKVLELAGGRAYY